MVIKSSSAAEIRTLIEALGSEDVVRRETAIARLAILGDRSVDRLTAAWAATEDRDRRLAILRALEPIGDPRAIGVARAALVEEDDVAMAATSVLRGLLDSPNAQASTGALDALVSTALDAHAPRRVRVAAYEALQEVPGGVRERVAAALREDPDAAVQARAADAPREAAATDALWQDALEDRLPERPEALRDAIQARSATAALGALQKMIDAIRAREGSAQPAGRRAGWRALRGALHQALALRGSHVAIYDLRESVEQAREPLPASFLAALHVVGDESCLEPLAGAYARADDPRWRLQVKDAFRAIARREKITRRHAAVKRIAGKWPDAVRELFAP